MRCGIQSGMPLSSAHALVTALRVAERDTAAEREALERLAAWAGQFTSQVSIVSSRALLLEVEGSLRLFGGLESLRHALRVGVSGLGYSAVFSVAPTPLAAIWLARAGDETPITDLPALAGRLFELPLACLDLSKNQYVLLRDIGLTTLGECLHLPRDGLARRLGAEFVTALDRAFGRLPDPRTSFVAPPTYEARLALPSAVDSTEGLLFPLNRLVLELSGFLAARMVGVQELVLLLKHAKAPVTRIGLGLAQPTRDARRLTDLFRERFARVELPEPVEEIVLAASRLLPLAATDRDFFMSKGEATETVSELIERLGARLGREAVCGLITIPEHRPEHAWHYLDARACGATEPGAATSQTAPGERPLWLLREPAPLEVQDGRPCLGGALELKPDAERIESGWWDGNDVRRDYYVARDTAGARLWIYCELGGDRRWFLHGVFG